MRILFLPGSRNAPSARFRLWQFVQPLKEYGNQVDIRIIKPERYWTCRELPGPIKFVARYFASLIRLISALWITRDIRKFDVIVINRDLIPETRIRFIEPWLAKRNSNIIFDFDDAIFQGNRASKLEHILPCFSLITAGNEYLANYARKYAANVQIWPTVVDTNRWFPRKYRQPGPIRIGWSGSRSTMENCLPILENAFIALSKLIEFELVVVADVEPTFSWTGVRVRFIPWAPETEIESLHLMDIGVMPLKDDKFQRGKCGAKAITYMSVGIPAVVSPVGVNSEIVTPKINGYHCYTDEDWIQALLELIQQDTLRTEMGKRAREEVIAKYSVQSLLPRMIDAFQNLRS